ncbi:MAG: sorbosone dehydrogenase family protein, partial [Sphingomonas bacterium]|nr:sorbosone dehydrogenase family protein [Sphingomonas bacterium]
MRHAPLVLALLLVACGQASNRSPDLAVGPNPPLLAPTKTLFPTVNIANAKGWPAGQTPIAAPGLKVAEFAGGLAHPRWFLVLPNGDVLVAETDTPGTDKTGGTIKGGIQKLLMARAGSGK